jgi:hypothetical protein
VFPFDRPRCDRLVKKVLDHTRDRWTAGEAVEGTRTGECSMKPVTIFIIAALVLAVGVLGYFYYQRTKNDVTIQLPKVELKP